MYHHWLKTSLLFFAVFTLNLAVAANNPPATLALPTNEKLPTPQPAPALINFPKGTSSPAPTIIPPAPALNANAYILVDANSGKVLAEKNADQRLQPASLTKLMTMYVVSAALASGRVHLDDQVTISEKAWRTGGSRMFVKVGSQVPVRELVQGIIVASGNDACVAMAEYVAGNEDSFAALMNQQAQALGMNSTHFVDSTGLPNPNHYTTARDLAILARAIIQNFPQDYQWYKQKWFVYNNIRQPNRNRLLWWDNSVDGLKTGHTDEAGFCLVASALRHDMRIIAIVLGAASDNERALDSQKLLNYGYSFFETHKLYAANTVLKNPRVWKGAEKTAYLGIIDDIYVTIPSGQFANLKTQVAVNYPLEAPITKGQTYGTINITINDKPYDTIPLVALQDDPRGGIWRRMVDSIAYAFHRVFGSNEDVA